MYDKLKKLIQQQQYADNVPHDFIFFRDQITRKIYKMYISDGIVCTTEAEPGEYSDETHTGGTTIINNITE